MGAPVLDRNRLNLVESALQQLELHVQSRLGGRVRDLRVLVRDGGVVLEGHAQTYHAKQLAQHAVMELLNARTLVNNIEVEPAPSPRSFR